MPDDLADGETLVDRRRAETERSAEALGIHRIAWLGYGDSGMTGWDQNRHDQSFHQADLDHAAERLAEILREENADVLTAYDWHGTYGHPDHIKVHHVGRRAVELVAGVRFLQATANRDSFVEMIAAVGDGRDVDFDFDPAGPADDGNPFGEPESVLTLRVDVSDFVQHKREAIAAHRSQVSDSSFFMEMAPEVFAMAFGTEWFIEDDRTPPYRTGWIFDHVSR